DATEDPGAHDHAHHNRDPVHYRRPALRLRLLYGQAEFHVATLDDGRSPSGRRLSYRGQGDDGTDRRVMSTRRVVIPGARTAASAVPAALFVACRLSCTATTAESS